jgi:alkaline phosphatase D
MTTKITRRQALLAVSAAALLPVALSQGLTPKPRPAASTVFAHGVASGDPDISSVVIWTRLSGLEGILNTTWRVATDETMFNIVATGSAQTEQSRDFTVKVVVRDLHPGQQYFYDFQVSDETSLTGRTKTLPVGHVENLVFAVVTCSNYAFGYFNAYEAIANDPSVDLVVHLGDYIYEHGADGFGADVASRIDRVHVPSHETLTLDDYRKRHAQYKTDASSQAMHAQQPLIVIWDDHETANNPWMDGAQNHDPSEGDWSARRQASLQAYYEWLPIREPSVAGTKAEYWRHFKFGDLVSLITLESRHTGRSQQISYGEYLPNLTSVEQAQKFRESVLNDTSRNMLSEDMESFLAAELKESVTASRRWRLIGNQSVIAKSTSPKLNKPFFEELLKSLDEAGSDKLKSLTRFGDLELPDDLDTWEGYPAARERFYNIAKSAGANDLLVLSGDSHSFWANQLFDENNIAMGLELGATGVTSPRSLLVLGDEGLKRFDESNAADNEEIVWSDGRHRGFIRLSISHQKVHADFIAVSNVETRDYVIQPIRAFDIEKEGETLRYS